MAMVSFRNVAVASLLSTTTTSAQQLIFLPTSTQRMVSSSSSSSSGMLGGGTTNSAAEPPCRQRRLEPWRQNVREQCHTDAKTHCIQEEEETPLRNNNRATTLLPSSSSMRSFDNEVDSFLDSIFTPTSSSDHAYHQQLDMDSIFNKMLGFSLYAFDQMMSEVVSPSYVVDSSSSTVVEKVWGEAEQDGEKKEVEGDYSNSPPASTLATSVDDEVVEVASKQAEGALDQMVANLAHRSIHRGAEGTGAQEEKIILPHSLDKFSQQLFQLGNDILSETTHSRRRLMEATTGEGDNTNIVKVDPHLQVKERLGRRLTEYRTDLFYHPSDGTITLYTSSIPSAFMMSPHLSSSRFMMEGGNHQEPIVASLGMGLGDNVDECMESRFDNGDLEGECHEAVQMFKLAVNNRSLVPPSPRGTYDLLHDVLPPATKGISTPPMSNRDGVVRDWSLKGTDAPKKMNHAWCIFTYAAIFLCLMFLFERACGQSDAEDDDDDDGEVGDVAEGDEFDYLMLPDDANEVEGKTRVFVGVPVQASPTPYTVAKYKTEWCANMLKFGTCRWGDKCHFIHDESERRSTGIVPSLQVV